MFSVIAIISVAAIAAVDLVIKNAVVAAFSGGASKEILFGLIRLTYVENTGAAFSSFSGNTAVLTGVTLVMILGCLGYLLFGKNKNTFLRVCLILITGGGVGNIIDRLTKGYVVDFIEPTFVKFAVFNFADCCITVGAFALLGYEIYSFVKETKEKREREK